MWSNRANTQSVASMPKFDTIAVVVVLLWERERERKPGAKSHVATTHYTMRSTLPERGHLLQHISHININASYRENDTREMGKQN